MQTFGNISALRGVGHSVRCATMRVLETSKLFGNASPDDLKKLKECVQIREFPDGVHIFQEGDQGDGLYLIREGAVLISAFLGDGGERGNLSKLSVGDFFGEMAVLDNEPRSATATAEGQTSLYFIPRAELLGLLENSPRLAIGLVREFSRRMRDFNRQYIREVLQAERFALIGRFARSIVHDLKNPLNVIGIAAEMASLESASPAMRASALKRIRKQVDRIGHMINELLEFTRGSQNSVVLAETALGKYVQQVLEELGPEIVDRTVTIEPVLPAPDVLVLMDPQRLMHVFFNLIHNAMDAMPDGGRIFLRVKVLNDEAAIEIEDTGKGVPEEILPRLFEAFVTHGKARGTGLGLSICKKIIEDHRGKISAWNRPGGGAVFTFTLPRSRRNTGDY